MRRIVKLFVNFCRMKLKDCLTTEWTKFTSLTYFESYPVLKQSIILLDLLPLPPHSSLSDIFQSCRNLTTAYFKLLHMISKQPEDDGVFDFQLQHQLISFCYFHALVLRYFILVMSLLLFKDVGSIQKEGGTIFRGHPPLISISS